MSPEDAVTYAASFCLGAFGIIIFTIALAFLLGFVDYVVDIVRDWMRK